MENHANQKTPRIEVRDLTMAYGDFVIQRDLSFTVKSGDIFIIMGGSGCGKSTLLRGLVGLKEPAKGQVFYDKREFLGFGARRERGHHEALRGPLPERCIVEFHDTG